MSMLMNPALGVFDEDPPEGEVSQHADNDGKYDGVMEAKASIKGERWHCFTVTYCLDEDNRLFCQSMQVSCEEMSEAGKNMVDGDPSYGFTVGDCESGTFVVQNE